MKTKRTRIRRPGPLQHALRALADAVEDLTAPQPHQPGWVPSRYRQLTEAIDITASRSGTGRGSSSAPIWLDPFMLADRIDTRTYTITRRRAPVPQCWRHMLTGPWRPQDTERLGAITDEIRSWCVAIDDLFAPQPVDIIAPCPQCNQTHTYRWNDDGERKHVVALVLTPAATVQCRACHQVWPTERLTWLGHMLRQNDQPPAMVSA